MYLPEDAEDSVIVRQVLAGDTEAFEHLVARHQRVLFTVALRMLGNQDAATDATQNALVKAYQKLDGYDDQHRFFSWIYRIVVNECLNVQRAQRAIQPAARDLDAPATEAAPDEALERAERHRRIQAALLKLPFDYRQVVVLRHYTELSYEDIAAAVGIPVKKVKSRLYTGRQLLAQLLGVEERNDISRRR